MGERDIRYIKEVNRLAVTEIKPSKEQWDKVYGIIEREIIRITKAQSEAKKEAN